MSRNLFEAKDGFAVICEDPAHHARDFLEPLGRLARGRFVLDGIKADGHPDRFGFRINGESFRIEFPSGTHSDIDMASLLVDETNRALRASGTKHQFALAVVETETRDHVVPR